MYGPDGNRRKQIGSPGGVEAHSEAMSREFPDIVDPWKAAEGRRTFRGTMPLKRMDRLSGILADHAGGESHASAVNGEAAFVMSFAYDRQGLVTIDIKVEAELPLRCQRSLAPFVEDVRRHSVLVVIEDAGEQDSLPESYEPFLVEERRVALSDLVEEELLLAVPQVPRSPGSQEIELSTDGRDKPPSGEEAEQTHRPFAGLAGLMKDSEDD